MIRDEISFCKLLDSTAQLSIERSALSALDVPQGFDRDDLGIEKRASGRTIPGDIALRLSRDDPSRLFYDITVVNCMTPQALAAANGTTPTDGFLSVLCTAFNNKIAKHEADVLRVGGRFVSLVVSTFGAWYPDSLRELRKIATYVSTRRGNSESESWRLLLAKVGCAMARGNALVLRSARQALSLALDEAAERHDGFDEGVIFDRDF